MTTVLSKKGQVVLPASVREKLDLQAGDDFEVLLEEDGAIVLRRINSPPNVGLVDHLLSAPSELKIPERQKDYAVAPSFDD